MRTSRSIASLGACDIRIRRRPGGTGVFLEMTMRLDGREGRAAIEAFAEMLDMRVTLAPISDDGEGK